MSRICVVTSQARAYYSLVSRLRKAELPFASLVPSSRHPECDLVLTTGAEAGPFGSRAFLVEELDDDPHVVKGQILSRLDRGEENIVIGVDPGARIGMAVYYGSDILGFDTFDAVASLCAGVAAFVRKVPAKKSLVRIGNGSPALATKLALSLMDAMPNVSVELVDEAGTSVRGARMKGVQGDQRAAARIAFRKGVAFILNSRSRV
jgi:hypothetical protein